MSNILFVQPILHRNFEGLLEGLSSYKYNVKYLCLNEPSWEVNDNINLEVINNQNYKSFDLLKHKSKLIRKTAKIIEKLDSDHVKSEINQFQPDFIIGRYFHLSTLELLLISANYKIPFLIYTQSHSYNMTPNFIKTVFDFIYSQKTGSELIYINPSFEGFDSESEFMYLPLSVPCKYMKSSFDVDNSHPLRVSCILDYRTRKRVFEFLQIVDSLLNEISLELHLIGRVRSDSNNEYSQMINNMLQRLQRLECLIIHGPSARDSVFKILRNCDVHVMPSVNEPFGFSNIEAMSQATIPMVHYTNGSRHTITHGKNGYLFRDDAELKNILSYLGNNEEIVTELKKEAKSYATINHNPRYSVSILENALSKSNICP